MSADLLRRAATKLREHANAATFPDGWAADLADSEVTTADGGMMIADTRELTVGRPDASYIALMHPPVALALAELFDLEVKHWDACRLGEQTAGAEPGILTGAREEAAHALARAILREPEVARGE